MTWTGFSRFSTTLNPLTTNVPHHIATSQLINIANQLTGFYMIGTMVLNGLTHWSNVCITTLLGKEFAKHMRVKKNEILFMSIYKLTHALIPLWPKRLRDFTHTLTPSRSGNLSWNTLLKPCHNRKKYLGRIFCITIFPFFIWIVQRQTIVASVQGENK